MREYPDALFRAIPNIFVDTEHAFDETGDLIEPLQSGVVSKKNIRSMGAFLSREKADFTAESGAFFKSVGYAAFDLFVARFLFQRGVENGKAIDLGI
jgi:ornithine cyclodeaminase